MVVRALSSTGESLVVYMKTGERSPELNSHINGIVSRINTKWEELKEKAELQWKAACERGEKFEVFVGELTDFYNWLSEFYSTVYDEFCERIPPKASDEIIAHHRTTLRVSFIWGEGGRGEPKYSSNPQRCSLHEGPNSNLYLLVGLPIH